MIATVVDFFNHLIKLLVVRIIDLPSIVNAIINGAGVLLLAFLLRWLFLGLIPKPPELERDFRLIIVEQAGVLCATALILIAGWVAYSRGFMASLADLSGHLVYFILLSLLFLVQWQNYRTQLKYLQRLAED